MVGFLCEFFCRYEPLDIACLAWFERDPHGAWPEVSNRFGELGQDQALAALELALTGR